MKNRFTMSAAVMAAVLAAFGAALADDAVGVSRVATADASTTPVLLPFEPMDSSIPGGFLSGAFAGDGGPGSDRVRIFGAGAYPLAEYVYSWNGWIAPPGATNAPVTVQAGDYFTFIPGVSGPSVFHVFGRAPDFPGAVAPYFSWMGVDPAGAFAELGIAPGGLPVYILSLSSSEGLRSSGWSHLGRFAALGKKGQTLLYKLYSICLTVGCGIW